MKLNSDYKTLRKTLKIKFDIWLETEKDFLDFKKKIETFEKEELEKATKEDKTIEALKKIFLTFTTKGKNYKEEWLSEKIKTMNLEKRSFYLKQNEKEVLALIKFIKRENSLLDRTNILEEYVVKGNKLEFKTKAYKLSGLETKMVTEEEILFLKKNWNSFYKRFKRDLKLLKRKNELEKIEDEVELKKMLQKEPIFHKKLFSTLKGITKLDIDKKELFSKKGFFTRHELEIFKVSIINFEKKNRRF